MLYGSVRSMAFIFSRRKRAGIVSCGVWRHGPGVFAGGDIHSAVLENGRKEKQIYADVANNPQKVSKGSGKKLLRDAGVLASGHGTFAPGFARQGRRDMYPFPPFWRADRRRV